MFINLKTERDRNRDRERQTSTETCTESQRQIETSINRQNTDANKEGRDRQSLYSKSETQIDRET